MSSYDLLSVAARYLNSDSFVEDSDFESAFIPNEADQEIFEGHARPPVNVTPSPVKTLGGV